MKKKGKVKERDANIMYGTCQGREVEWNGVKYIRVVRFRVEYKRVE